MRATTRGRQLVAITLAVVMADSTVVHAQGGPVIVTVDAAANRHAINPLVYGVHFGSAAALSDLNATVNRYGGNSSGRYNWVQNVDNRGGDYYFESIPYAAPVTGGEEMDDFIQTSKTGGAEPFLTMPMVGSVARTNGARDTLWSFSVARCGAQTDTAATFGDDPDAGNGCVGGGAVYPCQVGGNRLLPPYVGHPTCHPDTDASVAADHNFQQGWVQHVRNLWGAPNAGGLKFWGLDNEPAIWHNVYWDVHPHGAHDTETRQKMIDYGAMIKAVDSSIQVMGPEEYGWDGFFYSGADHEATNNGTCGFYGSVPDCGDHAANGDYTAYLLRGMRDYAAIPGNPRILDYFTLHYYPESFDQGTSAGQQTLRNVSTRELWDPAYTSPSFINNVVQLIPRMKQMVADNYPETKIGLTEYNWGAENHINGATAQADVLGIFGREGLDMAIRWVVPPTGSPVYNAFKMYRNYDGLKSTFGDVSVSTSAPNPDQLAAFGAQRTADGALTIMLVNKIGTATSTTVNLANFSATGLAQRWQLTSANTITNPADVPVAANSFTATLPAQSITLFVVPGGAPLPTLSIGDATVTEGDAGSVSADFTVSLSAASSQTVTAAYATADGTATAGSDYTATSGTVTFPPGSTTQTVSVTVVGDVLDESDETFTVDLTAPANATIADGQGVGTIQDDDAAPVISVADCAVTEGNTGTASCSFVVSLSAPSGQVVTVNYATADETATAGADYTAVSATLTFPPGTTVLAVDVDALGDGLVEGDETFVLDLSAPTNATIGDGQGQGTILDDDATPISAIELSHGAVETADLAAQTGPTADVDWYAIAQERRASYEVVVDGASGDVSPGVMVDRVGSDNTTVLQTGSAEGTGASVSLRWENLTPARVTNQHVRIGGAPCSTACGTDDVYRVRAYETTYSIPRFNNVGSQVTVLLIQNPTGDPVGGRAYFWDTAGTLLSTQPFAIAAHALFALNTSTIAALQAKAGTITISNDGRYGELSGKTVALEPSSGFSFDSPMVPRPK